MALAMAKSGIGEISAAAIKKTQPAWHPGESENAEISGIAGNGWRKASYQRIIMYRRGQKA